MPQYYSDTPFQNAYSYLDQARQFAMPSPESLDRASARVRSRVDNQTNTNANQINEQYVGSGLGVTGMRQAQLGQNRAAGMQALGSGLADVQEDYWNKQQTGATNLANMGAQYGNIAQEQGNLALTQGIKGREMDISQQVANEQERQNRAQLEQEHQQNIAQNLLNYFIANGQYGNLQNLPTGVADLFNQLRGRLTDVVVGAH